MAGGSVHSVSVSAGQITPVTVQVRDCTICGLGLEPGTVECPDCESRPRTRTIPAVLGRLALEQARLPLLAFAVTTKEATALRPRFPVLKSVSLHRTYGSEHESGIDARDLSRFAPDSFDGHFSSLLFDYFEEHELALAEAYRVIAPGGALVTHIAPFRLSDDDDASPHTHGTVLEEEFPAVSVGRGWFLRAVAGAGFGPIWIQALDTSSGEALDWFVGLKSGLFPITARDEPVPPPGKRLFRRARGEEKTLSTRVDSELGCARVTLRWSVPPLPTEAKFGSHQFDVESGAPGTRIVAVARNSLYVSDDLGESWEGMSVKGVDELQLDNAYVKPDGGVLAQARRPRGTSETRAAILTFDPELTLEGMVAPGINQWHGSSGIDHSRGTTIFGEYPPNASRPRPEDPEPEKQGDWYDSHLYRSCDGGHTWEMVHTAPWRQIRHFHTVRADPYQQGVWYASTGDRPSECHLFRSVDDGLTWHDATGEPLDELTGKPYARRWRALYRYTDVVFTEDHLIWGTDDFLGSADRIGTQDVAVADRVGSRLCTATKGERVDVATFAYAGNPVRTIVDVGVAWLVITQAKRIEIPRPQLFLVSKTEPHRAAEIGTVDLFAGPSSFTFSRASRAARDGRFFSFRGRGDVFPAGPSILQWDVSFD